MCDACIALSGSYDSTFDWMQDQLDQYEDLESEDPRVATRAWMNAIQQELGVDFENANHFNVKDNESELFMIVDVVMALLTRGNHKHFTPLPDWMPANLAHAAKQLAFCDVALAKQSKKDTAIRSLVHDSLAPAEERLVTMQGTFEKEIAALACTSKWLAQFSPIFARTMIGDRTLDPASLHTCGKE